MRCRQPLDESHKRFLAEEISRQLTVAADARHGMHRVARFLVDSMLWCWTADGIDENGVARRDLLKYDCEFQRHTSEARHRWENGLSGLRHEHAVPRRALIEVLLAKRATPHEVYDLLSRMCFAVVVTKEQDAMIHAKDRSLRDRMPFQLEWSTPDDVLLSRYEPFKDALRFPMSLSNRIDR